MENLDHLLTIAVDLNRSMSARDRYDRLLAVVRDVIPCDAACLLGYGRAVLEPLAAFGLSARALTRTYDPARHPRLRIIMESEEPVIFPSDSGLPDPFDHLIGEAEAHPGDVHSCMGFKLRMGDTVVGVLTMDALQPGRFDHLHHRFLELLSALAGSVLNTARLIDALEAQNRSRARVAADLQRTAHDRAGGVLVGTSPPMQHLRREMATVAGSDYAVLVTGESGSGKELVARGLHAGSPRAEAPLIYVNCAALPENLAESALFGHVRGAFTGAERDRAGKFEVAHGGTLFLDEIGELPLTLQPKLLRALQEGDIQRVGSDQSRHVDVRVIAATNRDLPREVDAGRFRADLYHRLNVYPIHVPPLRARAEDIPQLAHSFAEQARRKLGVARVRLPDATLAFLGAQAWPGNVRELRNAVSRALLRAVADAPGAAEVDLAPWYFQQQGPAPAVSDAPPETAETAPGTTLKDAVAAYQCRLIRQAVADADGNWSRAAAALGMDRSNFHALARRLGLK